MINHEIKLSDKFNMYQQQQQIHSQTDLPTYLKKHNYSPKHLTINTMKLSRVDTFNMFAQYEPFLKTMRGRNNQQQFSSPILQKNTKSRPYLYYEEKQREFDDIHVVGVSRAPCSDPPIEVVRKSKVESLLTKVQRSYQSHFFPPTPSEALLTQAASVKTQQTEHSRVIQRKVNYIDANIFAPDTPSRSYYSSKPPKSLIQKTKTHFKRLGSALTSHTKPDNFIHEYLKSRMNNVEITVPDSEIEFDEVIRDTFKQKTSPSQQSSVVYPAKINEPRKKIKKQPIPEISRIEPMKKWKSIKFIKQLDESITPLQRYHQYRQFMMGLNMSNNIIIIPQDVSIPSFKAIVTKGNNGVVVRNCIKARWWWTLVEKNTPLDEVNLIWNQNRKMEFYELIPKQSDISNLTYVEIISSNQQTSLSPRDNTNTNRSFHNRNTARQYQHCFTQQQVKTNSSIISSMSFQKAPRNKSTDITQDPYEPYDLEEIQKTTLKVNSQQKYTLKVNKVTQMRTQNHLEKHFQITNKKALFYNLSFYYRSINKNPFDHIPLTFHIQKGSRDSEFARFCQIFDDRQSQNEDSYVNLWIIKPGENTNRGNGIEVSSSIIEIRNIVNAKEIHPGGKVKTFIIQEYIQRPLLYNKRKFDIRCFMLMTTTNNISKGYWYQEGYIRTSSREFSVKNLDNKMIHLTNDAVQKKSEEYGKYESGNKVSFADFSRYLEATYPDQRINFDADIVQKLKALARDVMICGYQVMDPHKRLHTFELFGLDFMIDENFKPWLIEVNTNPCLETSCSLLNRIIPSVVEHVFRIAIDPIYPPPYRFQKSKIRYFSENYSETNRFELIFDSQEERFSNNGLIPEMDDDDEIDGDD